MTRAYLWHILGLSRLCLWRILFITQAYLGHNLRIFLACLGQGQCSRLVVKIGSQDWQSGLIVKIDFQDCCQKCSHYQHIQFIDLAFFYFPKKNHCLWAIFWIVGRELGMLPQKLFPKSRLCKYVRSIINFHPRNQDEEKHSLFDTLVNIFQLSQTRAKHFCVQAILCGVPLLSVSRSHKRRCRPSAHPIYQLSSSKLHLRKVFKYQTCLKVCSVGLPQSICAVFVYTHDPPFHHRKPGFQA